MTAGIDSKNKITLEPGDIIELRLLSKSLQKWHDLEHKRSWKTSDYERDLRNGLEVINKLLNQILP